MTACTEAKFPDLGDDGLPLRTLPQEFYLSSEWYERDLDLVFRRSWLFVCHISEIPAVGDYTTYELGSDSVVVARNKSGDISAFHNVCRHRGSRICNVGTGNAKAFVCPFHTWTYNLDGSLRAAPHMSGLAKSEYAAKPVWTETWNGLVFINFGAEEPQSVAERLRDVDFAGHRLEKAKVIAAKEYPTNANWKINGETYQECYHCVAVHGDSLGRLLSPVTTYASYADKSALDGSGEFLIYSADLREGSFAPGVQTESWDGQLVTRRLLGDEGNPQPPRLVSWFPNFSLAAFPDFGFIIDWIPVSATKTLFRTRWIVHEEAVEGRDYNIDDVVKMADTFNAEDKAIVERQQLGVNSSVYVPGPYNSPLEDDARKFILNYLTMIRAL